MREEDVLLSKMSYTDKDFGQIYPDLLNLAKQLTDKWDPSLSNESDPGVVLLKEGAFIADHANYNIDKNILESFLPSATQESSVRNILDLNGYTPDYYISASGSVSFTYSPKIVDKDEFIGFNIPEFTLVIEDKDESIAYTQIKPLSISSIGMPYSTLFMEGTKQSLLVNGNATILLENLDDNNRLYFPDKQVAENGIFIKNISTSTQETQDYWEKKNYISTQPSNSKVYKVGYDSALGVPYVEFPSDIANIIGNGITVDYILTNGIGGNVNANTLTKISSINTIELKNNLGDTERTIKVEDFVLSNPSSIRNGKNPETINEMYRTFQKVVGTFDTLVTCRDYSNAIYNLKDELSNKIISNDAVTDRNTDYNNSVKVVTYDMWGEYFETASRLFGNIGFNLKATKPENPEIGDIIFDKTKNEFQMYEGKNPVTGLELWVKVNKLGYQDFMNTIEAMTPYDLCIYALKTYAYSDYIASTPYKAIEKSFEPLVDSKDSDRDIIDEIKQEIESTKCINHDYLDSQNGDVLCFKNYVPLNITITPYNKVTKQEKEEIIDNIYKALSDNFNASKVDFGEELNYDEVLEVLLNCDSKIKNIRLEDFEYNPVAVVKDNNLDKGYREVKLYSEPGTDGYKILLDVVAKNVLAGRLCLFDFDDEFTYKYGQVEKKLYKNIASIKTEVTIEANDNEDVSYTNIKETINKINYKVNNLITKICVTGTTDTDAGRVEIPIGGEYNLAPNEILYVDIKGVVKEYHSDIEDTLIIRNYTESNIYIEYQGKERTKWLDLTEGYLQLVHKYEVSDSTNYDLLYKPKENEYIELAYNNYTTDATFPTYVNYRYVNSDLNAKVPANTDYLLGPGETFVFLFTENDAQKTKEYGAGEVIRANFEVTPTDSESVKGVYKTPENEYADTKWATLKASQQIEHRVLMKTELDTSGTQCYWIVNNNSNTLFYDASAEQKKTTEVILGSGEYFIYSDANHTSMVMLGPGTLLRRSENDTNNWSIPERTTLKDINENGFNANIDWKSQDFSDNRQFEYQEMNIVTLGNGDELGISEWEGVSEPIISNNWVECNGNITYTLSGGEATKLSKLPGSENYRVRSRLDLALNSTTGQKVQTGQKFIITYDNGSVDVIEGSDIDPVYIQSSVDLNLYGDSTINISDYTNGDSELNFISYKIISPKTLTEKYIPKYSGEIKEVDKYYYRIRNSIYEPVGIEEIEGYRKLEIHYFDELYAKYPGELWYIKDYTPKNSGNIEDNENYYTLDEETEVYTVIPASKRSRIKEEGITTFEQLYEKYPLEQWYIDKFTSTVQEELNKYTFNVTTPGKAEFMIGYEYEYNGLSDDTSYLQKDYILPVFLTYGGADITAKVEDTSGKYRVNIQEFNTGEPVESIKLSNSEMYLLKVCVDFSSNPDLKNGQYIKTNLKFTLSWDIIPPEPEILTILNPAVVNGINQGFGPDIRLEDVLTQIDTIIKGSTKPEVKPYYIYRPENSIAIQNTNILDPNNFWDKNNIINNLIIPQIDIRTMSNNKYPTIDIIKSMRNY